MNNRIFLRKYLSILFFLLFLMGCANTKFLVCGVDVKEVSKKDGVVGVLGGVVSFATHVAGHYIAAELYGIDFNQKGLEEIVDYSKDYNSSNLQMFARGGFIFQIGVNFVLTTFAKESYFTKGYTAFTLTELLSYPIRRQGTGDFSLLESQGANANFEYALYLALTGYNFYRISLEKDQQKPKILVLN